MRWDLISMKIGITGLLLWALWATFDPRFVD